MKPSIQKFFGILVTVALLGGMIFLRARISATSFDFQSSNFTFFWLAGRMLIEGENPYDEAQYLAGHENHGIKWQPNKIFPYPLPLAVFFIPLGLLSLSTAYITWQIITLLIVAFTIFILLDHWQEAAHRRLFIPVFIAMFFFGPEYLTLHTGSVGAFALLAIVGAILLLEKDKSLPAGILLSLTMLKPPQGATILLLAGIWFLARRNWKAIYGIALGGAALLVVGMIQDPLWLIKFRSASEAVMNRTQGVHSNVWSFSYLACSETSPCWLILGAAFSLTTLGLGGIYLWRNQAQVTAWEAFNVILPIGFVSTIYLWAYDQLLYIIPIVWIVGTLIKKFKSYIQAFVFLITLELISLFALVKHAETSKDLWSLGTTILVLATVFWLILQPTSIANQDISPQAD
jgi:hypothetical protein